jgi:porin
MASKPHRIASLRASWLRFVLPPAALVLLAAGGARADDDAKSPTHPVVVAVRDTLDLWRNTEGGVKVGYTELNKLQIAVTVDGDALGQPGWRAHLHYFRTNGESLSGSRVGDIQTASNIEALSTDRLMEAWVERRFGDRWAVKGGLMDLNTDFDSIEPAGLFLNSSHGIAPDLSHSGLNGPSIFPVSSLGLHGTWSPSKSVTLRMAVFDGVPGDPDHPKAFAAMKLSRRDGALLFGQADWAFADGAQASFGVWGYTADFDRLDRPGLQQSGQGGAYAYVEGALPVLPGWKGWARVGLADPRVAVVGNYAGFGVVKQAPFSSRPNDQVGFAVARAGLGGPARAGTELPAAEATFELTYRYQVNDGFALQPDLQYVVHPASGPGLRDALVVGLRLTLVFMRPADAHVE